MHLETNLASKVDVRAPLHRMFAALAGTIAIESLTQVALIAQGDDATLDLLLAGPLDDGRESSLALKPSHMVCWLPEQPSRNSDSTAGYPRPTCAPRRADPFLPPVSNDRT